MDMSNKMNGFFRRGFDRFVEARTREASRYVNAGLLMLDDDTLKARGYDRNELKKTARSFYF
jgi:hypothetical protein